MALKDLPGAEVWAVGPDGKQSKFGLWVYLPEKTEKSNYPQIGMAVIQRLPNGEWAPWMREATPREKYNPRVFMYLDAIPQLMRALETINKNHRAGSSSQDARPGLAKNLADRKKQDELDSDVKKFSEFW